MSLPRGTTLNELAAIVLWVLASARERSLIHASKRRCHPRAHGPRRVHRCGVTIRFPVPKSFTVPFVETKHPVVSGLR